MDTCRTCINLNDTHKRERCQLDYWDRKNTGRLETDASINELINDDITCVSYDLRRVHKKYKEWIKKQPCCNPECPGNCGQIVAAHQRILGRGGIALKPPDFDLLPLGVDCHAKEHDGAVTFWGQGNKPDTKDFVQGLCDDHYTRYKNSL